MEGSRMTIQELYYDDRFNNKDRKNDIKEMLCALEYCTNKSNGVVWVLHRENRNLNRLRDNGGYIDAPDDGRSDLNPARQLAIDIPVVMFIQQNGEPCKDENGENIGWNGAPFYWPVLLTQSNISSVMFALDQKNKGETTVEDPLDVLDDIDPSEVLSLTCKCDLETQFGKEGTIYEYDKCPYESRGLKHTTASRFLLKDEEGNLSFNQDIKVDQEHYHGVYSLNNGKFPFVTIPYKYICLRNGRSPHSDVILLELFPQDRWKISFLKNINKDGDLVDRDTKEILVHAKDTIIDKNLKGYVFIDESIVQWEIAYPIKKVLKLKKYSVDWDAIFEKDEE